MKLPRRFLSLNFVLAFFLLNVSHVASAEVLKIVVNDTIQPITDEYIGRALSEAARNKDQAVLIELSTPGGLLESTREIINKILDSSGPVIVYAKPTAPRA